MQPDVPDSPDAEERETKLMLRATPSTTPLSERIGAHVTPALVAQACLPAFDFPPALAIVPCWQMY